MRRLSVLVCILALLAAGTAYAQQTTGRMQVFVNDNEDKPLPGVTVQVTSDKLIGGPQVAITNADGEATLSLLPPGMYNVKADLASYTSAEVNARVNLGQTTTVRVQMVLQEFADEIEVVAEAPVVDTTSVDTGQTFDEDYLQNAAIGLGGRDYLSIIGQAAGVAGTGNVSVYGSGQSENMYMVDGMNTTDPLTATFGTNFNYDAIQEVNFLTGGFEAEYGQATGGVVNLVTKSGGNEFSGSLDMRYRNEDFNEKGKYYNPEDHVSSIEQYSATIGGPILRDKVWFFVSAENVTSEATPQPVVVDAQTRTYEGWNYIGKITWQAADAHRLIFKYSSDPADISNANASGYVAPEASRFQSQGGDIYQAELNSVLSDNLLLTAQFGMNRQELDSYPQDGDFTTPSESNIDTGLDFGNYSNAQYSERDRDQYRGTLSWFVDDFGGSHEFKAGVEYQKMESSFSSWRPGGYSLLYLDNEERGGAWYDSDADGLIDYILYEDYPLESAKDAYSAEGDFWTYYVQDAWRPMPNVVVKPGLRMDTLDYTNEVGEDVASLDKLQPRFGVVWDINNDARHVVRVNWGRFMHPGSLVLADTVSGVADGTSRMIGLDYWCTLYGYCDPDFLTSIFGEPNIHTDADGDDHYFFPYDILGLTPFETVDTLGVGELDAAYADTFILGYETQLWDNTSIEFSVVDKKSKDFFEDTCLNNTWAWGDGEAPDLDDPSTWTDPDECTGYVYANLPDLRKDYRGYIVKFESRAKDWFHLLASYTWSKSQGNYTTEAYNSYATAGWDIFPNNFVNHYGYLGDHRRHRIKANGYFLLPHDITIGFDAFFSSAPARTLAADCEYVLNASTEGQAYLESLGVDYDQVVQYCQGDEFVGTLFLAPRGSERGSNAYQVDVQASKGFQVGDFHLEAVLTVINLFSNERPNAWTSTATNWIEAKNFADVTDHQNPRRYELGFRVEF